MSRVDLNRIKVLLLDLDGTLINSEKAFCKAFIDVLNNYYKITVSTEEYVRYELEQNTMLIKQKQKEFPKLRNISDKEIMEKGNNDYHLNPLIDDDEAHQLQNDHDRILDAAKDAGFKGSNSENAALLRFYADFGLKKVLEGISACMEHSAPNIAYLGAVLKGNKSKPSGKPSGKVLPAQDFAQRDYSDVDGEMMQNLAAEMDQYLKDHPEVRSEGAGA